MLEKLKQEFEDALKGVSSFAQDDGLIFKSSFDLKMLEYQAPATQEYPVYDEDGNFVENWKVVKISGYFKFRCGKDTYLINIPVGFKYNGASVPKEWRSFISKSELSIPADPHDFLYDPKGVLLKQAPDESWVEVKFDKNDSDIVFRFSIEHILRDEAIAFLAYQAVSHFGKKCWRKKSWEK